MANIDDLFIILHHHWVSATSTFSDLRQLLQLALILLICAYTATRLEALMYVKRNIKVLFKCSLESYEERMHDNVDSQDN